MKNYEVRYLVEDIVFEVEAENKDKAEKKANEMLNKITIEGISTYEVQVEEV